jgi:hypothetical protein
MASRRFTTALDADGDTEYHDGTRVRAILQQRRGQPFPWVVHRINSRGQNTGCDSFRTRAEAHDFITDGRIFR